MLQFSFSDSEIRFTHSNDFYAFMNHFKPSQRKVELSQKFMIAPEMTFLEN